MKAKNVRVSRRNNSVDIFRYFCAILIVVIHTSPFDGTIVGTVLREYVTRIAVPYFLVIAGYFFFSRYDGDKKISRYLKHIIAIYFLWSIPYWLLNFYVLHNEPGFTMSGYIVRCVTEFLTRGSYYHFWFFTALIYSVLISSVLWKYCSRTVFWIISIVLMVFGCWLTSYSAISPIFQDIVWKYCGENGVYLLQRILFTGLPYFMLGGVVALYKDKFTRFITGSKKREWRLLLILCSLYVLEKIVLTHLGSTDLVLTLMLYPLVGGIVLVLLLHPMPRYSRVGRTARYTANFVYYIHPLIIVFIQKASQTVFRYEVNNTVLFLLMWFVTSALGTILSKNKRIQKYL